MTEILYRRAMSMTELRSANSATIILNGWHVFLVLVGNTVHALNDRCSHAAAPLSTGRIRHGSVMCMLHGARFDLASGKCIGGPHRPVRTFPVRIIDDCIEVAIPTELPGLSECPIFQT